MRKNLTIHLVTAAATCFLALGASGCKKAEAPAPEAKAAAPAEQPKGNPEADKAAAPAAAASPTAAADDDPGPAKTVTVWHAYRDAERAALDRLIEHWNGKHKNTQIQALAVPPDAIIDKFQVAVPNGNGPDIMIFAHDKIGVWARDGLIQPLGEFATPDRLKRFMPQTVKPLVFEKNLYGLPLAYKSLVLFYNKKMVPTPPTSLTQLIEVAKGFTKPDAESFGLAYEAANLYFHGPFLLGAGGAVFDETGALKIDSPEAKKAIDTVRGLYKDAKILPQGTVSGFVITSMFNDGKVPFVLQGPWFMGEIEKGVEWGVAVLPELEPGKPLRPFLGSEAALISAKTQNKDAALRVMDYLTSDEAALTRIEVGKQMVANIKTYEMPKWGDDPVVKVFRAQAETAVPMPSSAEMSAVWTPYNAALQKAIYGDSKSEEALAEAQKRATDDISKMKK